MLYIFNGIDELDNGFPERSVPCLSAERREKMLSYRFPLDRKLSAAAYLLLRLALKELHGINEPVVFTCGKHGKPYLRDFPRVYFNLSHCKRAVTCAVSGEEVGVDAEEFVAPSDEVARRVLTPGEYAAYKTSASPDKLFCEYWVKKESFLKKTGQGVADNLASLSVDGMTDVTLRSFLRRRVKARR